VLVVAAYGILPNRLAVQCANLTGAAINCGDLDAGAWLAEARSRPILASD